MLRPSLVLLVSLLAACTKVPQSSMKVAQLLDPEFYRGEIGQVDEVVFMNGRLDEGFQMEVVVRLDQMMRNVRLDDEAPATADTLMQELGNLYAFVASADTTRTMEASGIREEWTRIRNTYFGDADWFRHSPKDPVDDPSKAPPSDPANDFQQLGMRATTKLNEALYTLMAIAGAQQKDLKVDKTEVLDQLEKVFTVPSPITDSNFQLVRSEGLRTLHHVRAWMATNHDTLPGSPGRAAVDSIVQHLAAAQDALKEIEKGLQ